MEVSLLKNNNKLIKKELLGNYMKRLKYKIFVVINLLFNNVFFIQNLLI